MRSTVADTSWISRDCWPAATSSSLAVPWASFEAPPTFSAVPITRTTSSRSSSTV
jgi:hypothetical protein